jgi:hypothetical protein
VFIARLQDIDKVEETGTTEATTEAITKVTTEATVMTIDTITTTAVVAGDREF